MSTDLKMIAEKYQDYLIEMRRYFHRHPELSFREIETGNRISNELKAMGIECRKIPAGDSFGITGTIRGGRPGKTILLRADMDALPIVEETGLEYSSVNDGAMHACGHDCHIAILLAAAKILTDIRDELHGDVRKDPRRCAARPHEAHPGRGGLLRVPEDRTGRHGFCRCRQC